MGKPASSIGTFLRELRRRKVFRVAAVYAVAGWLIIQIAQAVFPALHLPSWTVTFIVVLLIIGFPITLILAWAFELTPEDVKRTEAAKEELPEVERKTGLRLEYALIVLLVIAVAYLFYEIKVKPPEAEIAQLSAIRSIAVLPLDNLSGDPEQDYFSDGMTEALITELSQIGALRVISRTSVMQYKKAPKPLPQIAQELNVDAIVEGSVLRAGDRVRITAQLIKAMPEEHMWAQVFDRDLVDVLALHSEVARAIAGAIKVTLTPEQEARLAGARVVNPETYEAYLKGMYYVNRYEIEKGLAYLNQAIEKNPADPLAYAGLALGYATIGHSVAPTPDAWPRARAAALRALRLDETLAEGHAALAFIKCYYERDWEGAEQAFLRADELNPNLAMNHYHYAWYLAVFGRLDEAIVEHKRAQELDPLTPLHTSWLGGLYWIGGDYEKAIEEVQKALELDPDNWGALHVLGHVLAETGMYEEAIAAHQKAGDLASLGRTYALAGRLDEARKILAELEEKEATPWGAFGLAVLYTALGEKDEAFRWLAYEPHHAWVPGVRVMPCFEPLWDDPRLKDLLQRMNLPER